MNEINAEERLRSSRLSLNFSNLELYVQTGIAILFGFKFGVSSWITWIILGPMVLHLIAGYYNPYSQCDLKFIIKGIRSLLHLRVSSRM